MTDLTGHGTAGRSRLRCARSVLFMPAERPDFVAKIPTIAPDIAVVDLEDAVRDARKVAARHLAVDAISALPGGAGVVLVRVNPVTSQWFADDVAAALAAGAAGVVVPKVQRADEVLHTRRLLREAGRPDAVIIGGIESARGVAAVHSILAVGAPDAAYFGAEDFIADMGGRRGGSGEEVLYARSRVCLAARVSGVVPIDQAVISVDDVQGFESDADAGARIGYQGKVCLNPRQVALAHRVFTPSAEQVRRARLVLDAAEGVSVIDGQMVDAVHVRMARAILDRAGAGDSR